VIGVSLEPFIWDVSYSNTTGITYNTSPIFAVCEQIYAFGGVVIAVALYTLIILKLRSIQKAVVSNTNTNQQSNESTKISIRIAVQAFLIGIFLTIFRLTVIVKPFIPAQYIYTLMGIRYISMWFHYTSTPLVCVCVSEQMRELLFCKGKYRFRFKRFANTVSTIAQSAV